METYLDRIKRLKNEKKMTNEQLADRSGIPLGTLSKLLAGLNDSPKFSNMIALCTALECSMEYIVSGTPDNTNNYTLTADEIRLMENYRRLDAWGRSLAETVIEKEVKRVDALRGEVQAVTEKPVASVARVLRPIQTVSRYAREDKVPTGKRRIKLYELPVSAGVGVYLDEERADVITIPNSPKTADADYALRISGNSMEPKYQNGDILLVQNCDGIEHGEAGIFLLDGSGYFKIYSGDRLLSLNPEYAPILLKDYADVRCKGRVVGRLKRK